MKILIILISMTLFAACQDKTVQYPTINLENLVDINKTITLSKIADSIQYIALETNDSCLLAGNSSVCGITNEYIYIRSSSQIYQFDLKGKFIKNIGVLGRGPNEYTNMWNTLIHNGDIYILTGGGEIIVYDKMGTFLRKNIQQSTISNIEIINDTVCIAEEKDYKDKGMRLYLKTYINGKNHTQTLLQKDDLDFQRDFTNRGLFYTLNNNIYYKNLYIDTIYCINNKLQPQAVKIFTYGKYSPNREMFENLKRGKTAINAGYIFNQTFYETKEFLFVWSMAKEKYYLTVLDKSKNQVLHNQIPDKHPIRNNVGLYDDITDVGTYFWPIYSFNDGDKVATLTNASNYSPETVEGFKKLNISIDENSNPILSICYLKD